MSRQSKKKRDQKKKKQTPKDAEWAKAKTLCRLSAESDDFIYDDWDDTIPPREQEIAEDDRRMLRRWEEFRAAAEYVADAFSRIAEVEKVVLFGSVAVPLEREIPRFRKYRLAGIPIRHECRDVDLAVWVNDLNCLNSIRKARSRALNQLLLERDIGVAHHQVEVFVMEPGSDRFLGRLCSFGVCPKKGKYQCLVPGCGSSPFLRQMEGFKFNPSALEAERTKLLYDRSRRNSVEIIEEDDLPF